MASDILIEIEQGGEEEDADDDIGNVADDESKSQSVTVYSRSSRGKTSFYSKGGASKFSQNRKKKSVASSIHADKKTYGMTKKSNVSAGSRMSKASMRDTKNIKTKNAKSVFTTKEEDFYPESNTKLPKL